ncbi:hypothetical protein [Aridibaculum aurantiacum]|uniref:hypothetical protein n=1 Tax=Aridibaculum aurantiacum TaxID=2810307 RepID=UPI001A95B65B|nr:hypothetical protein [Aridibaculum aurantiacum]
MSRNIFYSLLLVTLFPIVSVAQKNNKLGVFMDCKWEWLCDFNYVRQEIKMVDFVRDRFLADVHVLVNTEFSGGGGEQNTIAFIGLKSFSGKSDTLRYFNNPTMTDDEKRKQLVKYVKLGLVSYVAKSGLAEDLQISYVSKDTTASMETAEQQQKDKWNFWQLRVGASGFFSGNQNFKNENINSYISSTRETNASRTNINVDMQFRKSVYAVSATEKETVQFRDIGVEAIYVKKLSEHWGVGIGGDAMHSLFQNLDLRTSVRPRVEYSITPYSKFNSERIIVRYLVGPELSMYGDTTIYYKIKELQVKHSLQAIASFTKPWGTVNVGGFYSNYLSDFKQNNLSFSGGINWRIFKGFTFGAGGSYSIIRDQINIKKEDASAADVLTQRRALLSGYDYFVGVGFSYTFGSIFNNAVFPGFRGLSWGLNF